jgi:hypothetical protein
LSQKQLPSACQGDVRSETVPVQSVPDVSFIQSDDGTYELKIGEESSLEEAKMLKAALGLSRKGMLTGFLSQVANSTSTSTESLHEQNCRFALGFIQSIEPENEVEAALAAQMAAVHIASMDTSRRFMQANSFEGRQASERALNKLMRTFTMQMETLKRFRATAQQVVRVERVHVEAGGQAIVGSVAHGGRGRNER